MMENDCDRLILIITGSSLKAEALDRPLGYRLATHIEERLGNGGEWTPLVISDVLYLNDQRLGRWPAISLGNPDNSLLAALWCRELPSALAIDHTLAIQMDIELKDLRCCLWGINHQTTTQALDMFLQLGHLDRFLNAACNA